MAFGFGWFTGSAFHSPSARHFSLAGTHLLTSLLSFNAGVELGQVFVPAIGASVESPVPFCCRGTHGNDHPVCARAFTGWHWMLERGDRLRQFRLQWPELSVKALAGRRAG
jgi:hypothetical protein